MSGKTKKSDLQDLIDEYCEQRFLNVTFVVDDHSITANGPLLASKVPYFRTLLLKNNDDTKETKKVHLMASKATVEAFLRFVEDNNFDFRTLSAEECKGLLTMAGEFGFNNLLTHFGHNCSELITFNNVGDYYEIGEYNKVDVLMEKCVAFLASHLNTLKSNKQLLFSLPPKLIFSLSEKEKTPVKMVSGLSQLDKSVEECAIHGDEPCNSEAVTVFTKMNTKGSVWEPIPMMHFMKVSGKSNDYSYTVEGGRSVLFQLYSCCFVNYLSFSLLNEEKLFPNSYDVKVGTKIENLQLIRSTEVNTICYGVQELIMKPQFVKYVQITPISRNGKMNLHLDSVKCEFVSDRKYDENEFSLHSDVFHPQLISLSTISSVGGLTLNDRSEACYYAMGYPAYATNMTIILKENFDFDGWVKVYVKENSSGAWNLVDMLKVDMMVGRIHSEFSTRLVSLIKIEPFEVKKLIVDVKVWSKEITLLRDEKSISEIDEKRSRVETSSVVEESFEIKSYEAFGDGNESVATESVFSEMDNESRIGNLIRITKKKRSTDKDERKPLELLDYVNTDVYYLEMFSKMGPEKNKETSRIYRLPRPSYVSNISIIYKHNRYFIGDALVWVNEDFVSPFQLLKKLNIDRKTSRSNIDLSRQLVASIKIEPLPFAKDVIFIKCWSKDDLKTKGLSPVCLLHNDKPCKPKVIGFEVKPNPYCEWQRESLDQVYNYRPNEMMMFELDNCCEVNCVEFDLKKEFIRSYELRVGKSKDDMETVRLFDEIAAYTQNQQVMFRPQMVKYIQLCLTSTERITFSPSSVTCELNTEKHFMKADHIVVAESLFAYFKTNFQFEDKSEDCYAPQYPCHVSKIVVERKKVNADDMAFYVKETYESKWKMLKYPVKVRQTLTHRFDEIEFPLRLITFMKTVHKNGINQFKRVFFRSN